MGLHLAACVRYDFFLLFTQQEAFMTGKISI